MACPARITAAGLLLLLPALAAGGCGDDAGVNANQNVADPICGNGILEPGEQCDDGAENSDIRADACRSTCRLAGCGDGILDTGEPCDGAVLGGGTCSGLGHSGGTLACTTACAYDESGCTTCGNVLAEGAAGQPGYEACDGTDLRGETCASRGYPLGVLACGSACDFDFALCTGALPVITGIEGTGTQTAVVPRAEDQAAFDQAQNKRLAQRRIDPQARELVIQGSNIAGASSATAVGQGGQGSIGFEVQPGGTNEMLRLRFPATMSVTRGGLFLLTLVTAYGPAQAQVFFLQGQDGQDGQCTNTVTGDLTVSGRVTTQSLTVTGSVELPDCPSGYARDPTAPTTIVRCANAATGDEMVRVGDFWIDRYEASLWETADCGGNQYGAASTDDYPPGFPDTGNFTTSVFACSMMGTSPSRMMTWFQAQAACAASGKHLCTNAEWQSAAEGTMDSGPVNGLAEPRCNTQATGPRSTGQAGNTPGGVNACVSRWGAEDMVGNLWEWTADWWQAGQTWLATPPSDACYDSVWTLEYGNDSTWNLNGFTVHKPNGLFTYGLPAAALRGGHWDTGAAAGVFALNLYYAPSGTDSLVGARCCRQR